MSKNAPMVIVKDKADERIMFIAVKLPFLAAKNNRMFSPRCLEHYRLNLTFLQARQSLTICFVLPNRGFSNAESHRFCCST